MKIFGIILLGFIFPPLGIWCAIVYARNRAREAEDRHEELLRHLYDAERDPIGTEDPPETEAEVRAILGTADASEPVWRRPS